MSYREESLQRKEPPSLQAHSFYTVLFQIGTRRSNHIVTRQSTQFAWANPEILRCCGLGFLEGRNPSRLITFLPLSVIMLAAATVLFLNMQSVATPAILQYRYFAIDRNHFVS